MGVFVQKNAEDSVEENQNFTSEKQKHPQYNKKRMKTYFFHIHIKCIERAGKNSQKKERSETSLGKFI